VNLLIIGAGAIGSLVGAKLALQGARVTLAGRPAFAELVRQQGLHLEDETGTRQVTGLQAAGSIEDAFGQTGDEFDLAILTVKSYDTAAAIAECRDATRKQGCRLPRVLSLQNGVGNEEMLAAAFGPERVIAGTITTPVSIREPGRIRVDRPKYAVGVSDWQPGNPPAAAAIQQLLNAAGFSVTWYADARGMKWTKLLMNMAGNATCAILGTPPEVVFAQDEMVDLEIDAWREALAVMAAASIPPQNLGGYPFAVLAPGIRHGPRALLRPVLRKQIGGARGGKMPSLYLDLEKGKGKSEVSWLNGAVATLGEAVGVATPVNRALTETLLDLVANPANRSAWFENYARLQAAAGR
jgi:2-dehydropantoate 2-reductase